MSPEQGKFRFRMVETPDIDPGAGGVARFASQRGPIRALLRHPILEFALVGVRVAGGACAVLEMERHKLVRSSREARFMALSAGDGHMRAGQHKTRVLVLGNGEGRAVKILYSVAILA